MPEANIVSPTGSMIQKKQDPKAIGEFISSLNDERISGINIYGNVVQVSYSL